VIYGRAFWSTNSQKHPKGIYYWGFLIFTVFPFAEVVVELNRTEILSSEIIKVGRLIWLIWAGARMGT